MNECTNKGKKRKLDTRKLESKVIFVFINF